MPVFRSSDSATSSEEDQGAASKAGADGGQPPKPGPGETPGPTSGKVAPGEPSPSGGEEDAQGGPGTARRYTSAPLLEPLAPTPRVAFKGAPASLLDQLRYSIEEAAFHTQNRLTRALEVLDERTAQRQFYFEDAVGIVFRDYTRTLAEIRQELGDSEQASKQRMDLLESRLYDTMNIFIDVLRQLRSEVTALSESLSAMQAEARLVGNDTSVAPAAETEPASEVVDKSPDEKEEPEKG
ncbi:MAG TPA: hypothetical protein VHJ78_06805 [Actinomycetota bacterium]|nr:hypothetical protein [Actinomycetota bacterium]